MSIFESLFGGLAFPKLLEQTGDTITYSTVAGVSTSIQAIFNEQVGALDDKANAIFSIAGSDLASAPGKGDRITRNGTRWTVLEARDSEDGSIEIRVVRPELVP